MNINSDHLVEKEGAMAEWTLMLNDRVVKNFTLKNGQKVTIGRGSEADVVINNTAISRLHTALEITAGVYMVSDLGSLNGTYVNGVKITSTVPVSEQDDIRVGKFRLIPAEGHNPAAASSSSVVDMDMEDETVFVASKAPAGQGRKPVFSGKGRRLTVVSGNATPELLSLEGRTSIKIGKDPTCELILSGWLVAKAQCYVINRNGKYFLVPQWSWSATRVNGVKIKEERELRPEDLIEIRQVQIRYD